MHTVLIQRRGEKSTTVRVTREAAMALYAMALDLADLVAVSVTHPKGLVIRYAKSTAVGIVETY